MIYARAVVVMGRVIVSVWCQSHGVGTDHCLWSGRTGDYADRPEDVVQALAHAMARVDRLSQQGRLEGLTDECLR